MLGCSPFSSASRPRLDCPLAYQPRKAVSDSRKRRLRRFKQQLLLECCLLKGSSSSILRELPPTTGLVLGSTRSCPSIRTPRQKLPPSIRSVQKRDRAVPCTAFPF